jgi:uncharacterized membrane protein YgdD (TMEM256/DUF423 family)
VKTEQRFAAAGSLLAAISVIAGAFGAHLLRNRLTPDLLQTFETGARYQMYHALALFAAAWAYSRWPGPQIQIAGWLFLGGTVAFSGSVYALSLSGVRAWGAVAPVGGTAFAAGWLLLFWGIWKG